MAQYAQRASNDLYCLIYFKVRGKLMSMDPTLPFAINNHQGKEILAEGFIMRIRKNAIAVMCPRYGMEGPVYLDTRSGVVFGWSIYSPHTVQLRFILGRQEAHGKQRRNSAAVFRRIHTDGAMIDLESHY